MSRILKAINKAEQEKHEEMKGAVEADLREPSGKSTKASWVTKFVLVVVFALIIAGEVGMYSFVQEQAAALNALQTQLSAVEESVNKNGAQARSFSAGMRGTDEKISAIEQKSRALIAQVEALEKEISALTQSVSSIKTVDTSAFEAQVSEVKGALMELQDKIYYLMLKQARSN